MTLEVCSPPHTRLNRAMLKHLSAAIEWPRYALDAAGIGVAHIGPGAFHRAHQAWVFDDALAGDPRWGVSAISLKSTVLRDALEPQDGLYTVAVLGAAPRYRVIGALRETLVAGTQHGEVLTRMAAAQTRIVTLTVTEKGYCLDAQGRLDFGHPDIRNDLARTIVQNGWSLYELQSATMSLEDIFLKLTTAEESEKPNA